MADSQYWATNADGGYLANDRLSSQLRYALEPLMKFRQFVDVHEGWGKGKGDTVFWNKLSNVSTAGGTLDETSTMPAHQFTIGRGTIALSEWGNSIPYTGKLEALSEWDVTNPVQRVLRKDMAEVLDKACGKQFRLTQRKYTPLTATTGTYYSRAAGNTLGSIAAAAKITATHVKEVIDQLKKNKIPKYDGENYVAIGSVQALSDIKKSSDWEDAAKYGDPERLFSGEVGRYYGCRFVEENNYLSNTLGSGVTTGEMVIFGAEAVAEGVAVPEEVRAKIPTDYGRSKGLAWYAILGFEKIWKATDTDQDDHIIHISSSK